MLSAVNVGRMQQGGVSGLTGDSRNSTGTSESGYPSSATSPSYWFPPAQQCPQQTATATFYAPEIAFVSPTTPVAADEHDSSMLYQHQEGGRKKTPRESCDSSTVAAEEEAIALAPTMPHCKRSRGNLYSAPKQIPKNTFTSQIGSLVVNRGLQNPTDRNDARQVIGFRRQLSSSKIECFLSTSTNDHDADMDVDTEASRPRSMSF